MGTIKTNRLPNNLTTPSQLKATRLKREERSDAVQNRQKILQTAQQLFSERGVENVTMTEIAEKACLGKGTLYRHYSYKGQLCFALLEDKAAAYQNEVLSGFGEAGRNTTPLGRVYMFMDRYLEFVDQNNALLNAAFESTIEQKNYNQFLSPAYDSNRLIVTVLLKEAVASGECRSDLDIDYIALSLLAALQSNLFTLQRHVLGFSLERIKAGIRQLFEGILA